MTKQKNKWAWNPVINVAMKALAIAVVITALAAVMSILFTVL